MTSPLPGTRTEIGALGEELAVAHLQSLGMAIIERNWRCRYGELDVIAEEPRDSGSRTLVFVEVKTRTGDGYGGIPYAVTRAKLQRLRRLAGLWLADQPGSWPRIRIDVVGVRLRSRRAPELTHLKGVR
ncbi:YraN family protein [Mycolicibacterium brumae]|uniref:UPF0102 protein CQY22_012230 n=1 Tax=Mycolicibacterium brumae TaxID=85968 RepID=A0A2G5P9T3_9MYCO|nr:YraN family protein [Mycolicibacterium brumae]MCV7193908.1 YraN family protein [Mycolicibacterium brumae]PIB74654.1 YraN family protein [Mycolicibacterium brumae]RWA21825.1 hypothetical protein MBRU_14065 [Mycolicibacterium brumae DSM 44177]UWW08107.1 YraN family protein [Mycolicibacterium brumae]